MSATPVAFATKDNASARLQSGINNSVLAIPLQSGNGANLPQPYTGTASSSGDVNTLNCTGISAVIGGSAAVGKPIWNKTDGSVAFILSVSADSLETTRLLGGADNSWDNGDTWCLEAFVATFAAVATNPYGVQSITAYEQALVTGRSSDTLAVATGGRGYNGTVANSFVTGDYVYLFVTSPILERLKDVLAVMAAQQDVDRTTLATALTNIANLQTGAYNFVVTSGSTNAYVAATPALAAYAAGNLVVFKANFTNTGSATLNLNGLGAKTIKRLDGVTNLAANDIISGQLVMVWYDGTNFQMLSPAGTPPTAQVYEKPVYLGASDVGPLGASSTVEQVFTTHLYQIPANDLVAGVGYRFRAVGSFTWVSGGFNLRVKLGSTIIVSSQYTPTTSGDFLMEGEILGTAGAGGSVAVRGALHAITGDSNAVDKAVADYAAANVATNGALDLQFAAKFDASNGGHGATLKMVSIEKFSTSLFS
jgi:hypothetical protein